MAWVTSGSPPPTVLLDANVLYPAPLRDLLLQLALADLFRAKWTNAIHDEWIGSVLADRPDLTRPQLERTRGLMNAHVRDCLVTGFEALVAALELPDPNDRHVLAAAIVGRADMILTFNLKDFPQRHTAPYRIAAQHPDAFVARLLELDERRVCGAVRECRQRLRSPPKTVAGYLDTLAAQRLPATVSRLRGMTDRL